MGSPYTFSFTTGTISGTPLPPGYLKTVLHLGASQTDAIVSMHNPNEMEGYWDFFQLGGLGHEHLQQPFPGRAAPLANFTTTQTPMVWTALTDNNNDGVWDEQLGDRYATYAALYLVVPTTRIVQIVAQFDDFLSVWLDGNATPVFKDQSPSALFNLTQGLHILMIRHGDITSNDMYALKITDPLGADVTDLRYVLDDVIAPRVRTITPSPAAVGVDAGSDVIVQFSEAMNTTTLPSAVASLTGGTATGSWSWTDAYTLVWTPAAALDPSTTYTVTLTPAQALDLRGLSLIGTTQFTFTTGTVSSPASGSILPASGTANTTLNLVTFFGSGFQKGTVVHPPGAIPFEGHYYRFINSFTTFGTSQSASVAAGGHLAILNSAAEDDFVWKMGGRYNDWIGASDAIFPGGWKWVSGDAMAYTNWAPNEPNNWLGGGEHWGCYWYGFWWNDVTDGGRPYVQEFDTAAVPSIRLTRSGQSDIVATNVLYNSAGSVSFDLNLSGAATGQWNVVLTNPDGGTTTLSNGFTVDPPPPPPTVTNVSSTTGNGTYGPGQTVAITVQFSSAVTVTGVPQLTLETGASDAVVNYAGGSGTPTLTFSYLVAVGHSTGDLDYLSTSALALNGGTIKDALAQNADLTLASPGAAGSLGANKDIQIVTPPPATVTNVSSTTGNGTYGPTQTIAVTVQFSAAVYVTGTPRLTLETGAADAVVNYTSGTGTGTLTFNYTVAVGHASSDLDYVSSAALALNGGTLKDIVGQNVDLTLPAPGAAGSLGANKDIQIVTPPPQTVTNVSSPAADGTYGPNQTIAVTVQFSAAVVVTGTPRLTLETGASDAVVNYTSGSGTSTLTFNYTVAVGHASSDLDYVSSGALALNGGTIKDGVGQNVDLTLPAPGASGSLGANKDLQVVTPPALTVSNVSSTTANGTYGPPQTIAVTVQFSGAVVVTGTPRLTLETGASDAVANYTNGSGTSTLTFTYTVGVGHTSSDLDYVSTSSLTLNGGTIKDALGQNAVLTLPVPGAAGSLGANKDLQVATPPAATVLDVSSPAPDGSYGVDQVILITVKFSTPVVVTGTPRLMLETGASDAVIDCISGSGTSTLTFVYTVATGQFSPDLDYLSTSALNLNGGSIQDTIGQNAVLTLPAPGAPGSLGANKALRIHAGTPSGNPLTDITVKGCGLTGLEVLLLIPLAAWRRRRRRR
jgi:hypothetical protein